MMPNTVVSANDATSANPWEQHIKRTSDGTIHVIIKTTQCMHYYSYDKGVTWNATIILDYEIGAASFDIDSNDNLHLVWKETNDNCFNKKGTVTKGTPWTWSWAGITLIDTGVTGYSFLIDGNNYFHVAYAKVGTGRMWWARSITGGSSWIITEIPEAAYTSSAVGIVKDSINNLYIFHTPFIGDEYLWGIKITYSAGPSWSIGPRLQVSTQYGYFGSIHVLPNDRLIFVYYMYWSPYSIRFRKSTNPSDITSWGSEVVLGTLTAPNISLMVISNTRIKVYYCVGGILYYKESMDGGVTFGDAITVYSIGTNTYPHCSKAYTDKIDYIWRNGTANPYTIYHARFSLVFPFFSVRKSGRIRGR